MSGQGRVRQAGMCVCVCVCVYLDHLWASLNAFALYIRHIGSQVLHVLWQTTRALYTHTHTHTSLPAAKEDSSKAVCV